MRAMVVFETQQTPVLLVILTEGEVKQLTDPEADAVEQIVMVGDRPHKMRLVCDDEAGFNPDLPSPDAKVIGGKRRKGKIHRV